LSRLLAVLGLVVLVLAVLAAAVGYLAYGTEPSRTGRLALEGLQRPVAVGWDEEGRVTIEAASEPDLAAALGYVHGVDDAWALALWRQAAVGSLAEWFGERYVPFDRHARTLGFRTLAYHTYAALPDSARALLDAYARGVNRALADAAVAQRDEFVLLDVAAEPFEPWHALAVERLFAWVGTPPLRLAGAAARDSGLVRFARTDSLYRAFLHLGGTEHSRAWVARLDSAGAGTAGTAFVQQHAYGASALPLVREVTLRRGGRSVTVATVPGTLVLPGGVGGDRAWSVFLTSAAALDSTSGPPPPLDYDRLVDRAGNETLLPIRRGAEGLFFEADVPAPPPPPVRPPGSLLADSLAVPPLPADTAAAPAPAAPPPGWVVRWPGFALGTDVSAWWALVEGRAPAFRLFRGDGLTLARDGAAAVLGSPPVRQPVPGGVFVAADSLTRFAAARLAGLLTADTLGVALTPGVLAADAYSPWAAARLPGLLAALGHRDSLAGDLRDAHAYLLSWDARYTPDAIGASLFETWLTAHAEELGAPPAPGDSVSPAVLQQTLRLAVAILRTRHGERPSAWRWERVQPGARFFPVWTQGGETRGPAASRYAPVTPGLGGHPTALFPGPSLFFGERPAPAVWTAWVTTVDWDRLAVRHPVVETDAFLARARSPADATTPYYVARAAPLTDPLYLLPPGD
jgi:hypothetical protein